MFKILIATHGKLADGFKDAISVIIGDSANIETVGLFPGDDVENFGNKIHLILQDSAAEGIIVFTDLVCASPYNQSMLAINRLPEDCRENCYLIGGVNLPMMIETINHQFLESDISTAVTAICEQGSSKVVAWNYAEQRKTVDDESDDF